MKQVHLPPYNGSSPPTLTNGELAMGRSGNNDAEGRKALEMLPLQTPASKTMEKGWRGPDDRMDDDAQLLPQPKPSNSRNLTGSHRYTWKFIAFFLLTASLFYLFISQSTSGTTFDIYRRSQRWSAASCTTDAAFDRPPGLMPDTKIILFWTRFFSDWDVPYLHDKMAACFEQKCLLTDDRRYLQASSAIVFHVRDDLNLADLPRCRSPKQLYVFFLLEAVPYTNRDLKLWAGFFNLTWTYRRDSDVFNSFYMEKYHAALWSNVSAATQALKAKKNRALVFSSHCPTSSRREEYIAELQRYFPVDIVGSCGPGRVDCPKHDTTCDRRLIPTYKFYLAFENSYCDDYVTEKVMRALNFESLPVVYGAANYSHFMPPHSFINTASFPSPKDLAAYLWNLTRNPLEYAQYFQWKLNANYTRVRDKLAQPEVASTCGLCRLLHDKFFRGKRYDDLHGWWVEKGNCSLPTWFHPQRKPRSQFTMLT
ncbi:hypothetical protein RvY_03367 [Ramazzottius varieornatus]|uniref:Fucosyltransferase n=1 Tax=Ramazzottius varieornatus TaxID=947166 RepID=A0A1D1UUV4_RAMVA|nr:hypothetical protein RvY_03367 [Ramazzottius varieornatus]